MCGQIQDKAKPSANAMGEKKKCHENKSVYSVMDCLCLYWILEGDRAEKGGGVRKPSHPTSHIIKHTIFTKCLLALKVHVVNLPNECSKVM